MTADEASPRLHACQPRTSVAVGTRVSRAPWPTIDVHCHVFLPGVEELVADQPRRIEMMSQEAEALGPASRDVNAGQFAALKSKFQSVEERLSDMNNMGVDIQVLSPSPTQYHHWAEPALAARIADLQNDHISALCDTHPDRFLAFGAVSLQDPRRAADQLEYLVSDRGFKGVEISTHVEGLDIADRSFDPFWARAEQTGAVVFIHPWGSTIGKRLAEYYLLNTIGQPLETTICFSKLIFGGTLDRHPALRLIAAHGGGYLPAYVGRSDHAHSVRPEAGACACQPSDYLRRIWYDTVIHDADQLARLIDQVGADRILTGSDYPFDMGEYHPAGLVAGLPEPIQRKILGENAQALLGLTRPGRVRPTG